jgi:hypothetical protein
MHSSGEHVGPFCTVGPFGWTIPTAIVGLAAAAIGLVVLAFWAAAVAPPPADIQGRLAASFATLTGVGFACLPLSLRTSASIRAACAIAAGLVGAAGGWLLVMLAVAA